VELTQWLRLAHALAGVAFMAGIIGNWFVIGFARRAESLDAMRLYLQAAEPFAKLLTGGGISLTVLGVATAVAMDRPLFGPLQGGQADWLFAANLLMLPLIVAVTVVYPRVGRRIRGALEDAKSRGSRTPELTAAWADWRLRLARTYELVAMTVVLGLMIAKPF
jgi:uncharacterized membrane protein